MIMIIIYDDVIVIIILTQQSQSIISKFIQINKNKLFWSFLEKRLASTIIKEPKQVLKSTVHLYLKPNVTFCNKNMEEKEKDLNLKNLFLVFIDVKWGQFLFEQLNVIQHLFLYSFYQWSFLWPFCSELCWSFQVHGMEVVIEQMKISEIFFPWLCLIMQLIVPKIIRIIDLLIVSLI